MFHPRGPTFFELARQALSSTEGGYDLLAPKFDRTPFRTPEPLLQAFAPHVGPPGSVGSALDLCCGTGAAMATLRHLCRERVVGVDFSRGMLAEARQRFAAEPPAGQAELGFLHGDVLELDFEAEFDVVTCFGALGHFTRRQQPRLAAVAARALRPGGRFLLVTSELPPLWSWRLWLAAGFDATMAARNVLWRPPFVMYYLALLLPRARRLLAGAGLEVEVRRSFLAERPALHLVIGCRRHQTTEIFRPEGAQSYSPGLAQGA